MTNIPAQMQAIEIPEYGDPEVMRMATRDVPEPGPGEVLIENHASSVNRPDVLQRQGGYAPPPGVTDIPGLDAAGIVVACGADVTGVAVGDAVCALVPGGGYAEYCVAPAGSCLPLPEGFDMVQAACLPETFFTVWSNVFDRGRLQSGESLLVHGGSSGIGTTAIQMAACLGATVYTTAGTAEKCALCEQLGATRAINYREEDYVAVIKESTQGKGVDVILDMVGGDYLPRNIKSLATDGRLVQIAFLGGSKAEVDFLPVMLKRLTLTGSTLRIREPAFKAAIARNLESRVWPLLASGKMQPIVDSVVALAEVADAHRRMESGANQGKIGLRIRD